MSPSSRVSSRTQNTLNIGSWPDIVLARDRDARASILGYVYQVHLTILRWLALSPEQVLELERGEDIDSLSRGIAGAEPEAWGRVMEQVKHLARALTLRSPALRSAFANFYEHFQSNHGVPLIGRFSSNAAVTREKGNTLPAREAGILAWQRLSDETLSPADVSALVTGIRSLLTSSTKPKDIPAGSWSAWQSFIAQATEQEFLLFVRRVEIATRQERAERLRPRIERVLLDRGFVVTDVEAERAYPVLFAHVFKLLCEPGLKRLSLIELREELDGVGAGATDHALLQKLESLHAFELRLAAVEGGLVDVGARVDSVTLGLATLQDELRRPRIPAGVRPGDTQSFQLTGNHFRRELEAGPTFNHARELKGRDEILGRAIGTVQTALASGVGGVLIVGGVGGVGKSRFLIELARRLELECTVPVRWLRDQTAPGIDSLDEVPSGPLVLFSDDGHRRLDLEQVVSIAESRRDPTMLVIGVRPRGRGAVLSAALHSGVDFERVHDLGDLTEIGREDLLTLLREELGADLASHAEAVLRTTGGSALVALIASRLLRTRQLHPRVLAQDQEIRYLVLNNFEDEAYGRVGPEVDPNFARRCLELFSVIAPVAVENEVLVSRAATFLKSDPPSVVRTIGLLEEAGVLRAHRSGIRITPDVVSDHILHRTLVGGSRPTGFEHRVLDIFGTEVLGNVVRNAAELDWQLGTAETAGAQGAPPAVDVFSGVWDRFVADFRSAPNYQRVTYLEQLRPVAAFQPARVLDFCEWLIANPEGDDRPSIPEWGASRVSNGGVIGKVPSLIAITAQHEEHFGRGLDLLWSMGREDKREVAQNSDHAIQAVKEIATYSPGAHRWVQERAIASLRRWTDQAGWSCGAHSPLVIASAVLRTSIVEDTYNPRTNSISMQRYGIDPEMTRVLREETIAILADLSLGPEPRGRVWAADILTGALRPPESHFGHVVTDAEEDSFRAQYDAAFEALERLRATSTDPLVLIRAKDALLRAVRQTKLDRKREIAEAILARFDETEEMIFARAWGRTFHAFRHAHVHELGVAITQTAINSLSAPELDAHAVIERLRQEERRFAEAGVTRFPRPVIVGLAQVRPDLGVAIAEWISDPWGDESAISLVPVLAGLLATIRMPKPDEYARVLERASTSTLPELRAAAARGIGSADTEREWDEQEQVYLRSFLGDGELSVRIAAVGALHRASRDQRGTYIASLEIAGSWEVADALAEFWSELREDERPTLSAEEIDALLAKLEEVPDLASSSGWLEHLVAELAKQHPLKVVEFLLARGRREQARFAKPLEERGPEYDAVPHGRMQEVWTALQSTVEYGAVVHRLLHGIAEEALAPSAEWPWPALDVARRVIAWDPDVERVIRGWMEAGRCADVAALAGFLDKQGATFVLDQQQFVVDLLRWAEACGEADRARLTNALAGTPFNEIRTRSIGVPSSWYVRIRDDARGMADEYRARGAEYASVTRFYDGLGQSAAQRLTDEAERDERLRQELLPDDWDE